MLNSSQELVRWSQHQKNFFKTSSLLMSVTKAIIFDKTSKQHKPFWNSTELFLELGRSGESDQKMKMKTRICCKDRSDYVFFVATQT
jgi:hypothetical protein